MYEEKISHSGTRAPSGVMQDSAANWANLQVRTHGEADRGAAAAGLLPTTVSKLIEAIAGELKRPDNSAEECVRRACALLQSYTQTGDRPFRPSSIDSTLPRNIPGGMAPWQIRRLKTHIDENLSTSLRCEDLARMVRLSVSHFARTFKHSFGYSPHAFLMRRRMEHAQGLMLASNASLGQIAQECGLSDQAHLSRLFQQFTGESPGAWRRARANEPN